MEIWPVGAWTNAMPVVTILVAFFAYMIDKDDWPMIMMYVLVARGLETWDTWSLVTFLLWFVHVISGVRDVAK